MEKNDNLLKIMCECKCAKGCKSCKCECRTYIESLKGPVYLNVNNINQTRYKCGCDCEHKESIK